VADPGQRTLEDLCRDSDFDPFDVYRVVYGLYANKLIEVVPTTIDTNEDTNAPNTTPMPTASGDATFRQDEPPAFSGESTMRDAEDDTSLLVSTEAKLSYADVVRPTIAQLTIAGNETDSRVVAMTETEYLIGRHRDNSIQLSDPGVSGFHARLYLGPDGYIIEDMKSRNGVWVNGIHVDHVPLQHGDRIHIGQTDLLFEVLFRPS
jgi:hypothetical protein